MLSPLANAAYRHLFAAQISALLGTGLATIALGLLAHDLAGAQAGEILGAALAIKMVCYVGVAPIASAIAAHVPRKTLLVGLDLVRALVAIALPFVAEAWQIYALMTVLYVASAAFTPAFQAMIPDILPDEADYTKALSLSRLAADLESVASPILAAALLGFMTYNNLFAGTSIGFVLSAMLVVSAVLPALSNAQQRPFIRRLTSGLILFARTPRLRALIGLSLATAAGGAMVFVNTVVLVQSAYRLDAQATAWALAVFGAGSIFAALALPRLLEGRQDRTILLAGAVVMSVALGAGAFLVRDYASLLLLWGILGAGYSLTMTPVGRVLRRSSHAEDRPALFAAQFALSHGAWLVAYPLSGFVSASFGTSAAFAALCALCLTGVAVTAVLWPSHDPENVPHRHDDLPADHPHIEGAAHAHPFIIDDLHTSWPKR
jgi:predicted MFS family arabinose efflux permease